MQLLASILPPDHQTGLNLLEKIHNRPFIEGVKTTEEILQEEKERWEVLLSINQTQKFSEKQTLEDIKVFKNFLRLLTYLQDATLVFRHSEESLQFDEVESLNQSLG